VPVHPSTRQHLDDHLGQAEFALKVAMDFECLKGTPAHEHVRAALAQVAQARTWVKERLAVEQPKMEAKLPLIGQGLPLTRRERLGYHWP
jgi:hypothetical protein